MSFDDPIIGGTVLRIPAIQSPNYVPGVSGWAIFISGNAEFNDVTVRGEFEGTDFIIDSSGIFFYGGTPAAGNLMISIAAAAGADQFGNTYPSGISFSQAGRSIVMGLTGGQPLLYFVSGAPDLTNSAALQDIVLGAGTGRFDFLQIISAEDTTQNDLVLQGFAGSSQDGTQLATINQQYKDSAGTFHTFYLLNKNGPSFPLGLAVAGTLKATGTIASQPAAAGNVLLSGNVNGADTADRLQILANSIAMGPGTAARDAQIARTAAGLFVVSNPTAVHGAALAVDGNVIVGGTAALGDNGAGELQLANAATVPSTNPAGGGVFYASSGVGHWRDSGGQVSGMVRTYSADATGDLVSFTTEADVPGASVSVVIVGSNATVLVAGQFDFDAGSSACNLVGFLNWNGSDRNEQAIFTASAAGNRSMCARTWRITGVSAGTYTAKLRASCTVSGPANGARITHTGLTVTVIDQ